MPWSGGIYRKANYATNGWTGDASNNIGIEAGRHDNQDDDFMTGINNSLNKAGQNTPTANLPMGGFKHTGCADATANDQYATYGQLNTGVSTASTPPGVISMYGGPINPPSTNPPSGWLYCDGTAYSRTSYSALFAVIGTAYGVGDGTTTFNVPNMQQRFPLGKAASGTGATLGGTGGSIDHTHTSAAHTHTVASHTHTVNNHTHTIASHQHTIDHTHTVAHSHPLSDAGAAKISLTSTNLFVGRGPLTTGWTATNSSSQSWGGSSSARTDSVGLIGNTDSVTPTTSSPNNANSGPSGVLTTDPTALTTNPTSLTTDPTTPGVTGTNNPPFITVNFIIKT